VQTKDLVFDEGGQRKIVEEIRKHLPNVGTSVFAKAFVIEAINLCDLSAFVVPSQNGQTVLITYLEGNEKGNGFDGIVATIDIVAHEKVVGVGAFAADPHQFVQIV